MLALPRYIDPEELQATNANAIDVIQARIPHPNPDLPKVPTRARSALVRLGDQLLRPRKPLGPNA